MSIDLFISYAWTSEAHRDWVRLLASQLHLIGYTVKIDEAVDYGSSLNGFMREVVEAAHVLLIVDENYVDRADNKPDSGVGVETKWISGAFMGKPATWLSVIFVRNPGRKLPNWLNEHNPKGFDFNSNPEKNEFPGSVQIDLVWRWIEGLSADKSHAVPLSLLRLRAARLERVAARCDSGRYANPAVKGCVTFPYREGEYYTIGHGDYEFQIKFGGGRENIVRVYKDHINAIGLITGHDFKWDTVEYFITQGREVTPTVGQSVVLLNSHGSLCVITIDEVQREVNAREYVPEHVKFTYEIRVEH